MYRDFDLSATPSIALLLNKLESAGRGLRIVCGLFGEEVVLASSHKHTARTSTLIMGLDIHSCIHASLPSIDVFAIGDNMQCTWDLKHATIFHWCAVYVSQLGP